MLYFDFAIITGEIAGLILSTIRNGWSQFVYYTQLSNYFLLIMTVIHFSFLLRREPVPKTVNRLQYIAVCTTTVTFAVVVAVLVPWSRMWYYLLLYKNDLFQHLLCPVLGIAELPLLMPVQKKDCMTALIPTMVYGLVFAALNCLRLFSGPYPFFMVYHQPWFISVLWFIALNGGAYGLAILLRRLCGRHSRLSADFR